MDLDLLLNHQLNAFSLGSYLGVIDPNVNSNQQGLKILQRYGVVPTRDTVKDCPECGLNLGTVGDRHRRGFRYVCGNHAQRRKFNPYHNTLPERVRSNTEMRNDKIMQLIFCWLDGVPATQTKEIIEIAQDTVIAWYGYCRDVACAIAWHEYVPIGGPDDIVEVDESHLFKRKYNVDRELRWMKKENAS